MMDQNSRKSKLNLNANRCKAVNSLMPGESSPAAEIYLSAGTYKFTTKKRVTQVSSDGMMIVMTEKYASWATCFCFIDTTEFSVKLRRWENLRGES